MATKAQTPKRKRKNSQYKHFKLSKKIKSTSGYKLSSSFKLLKNSVKHLLKNKKIFFGLALIYLILNIFFVKGLSSNLDIGEYRDNLKDVMGVSDFDANLALVGVVSSESSVGSANTSSTYQSILIIIFLLALIWTFRQTLSSENKKLKVKQPFYQGMTPFVPFILVLLVIGLQLLPMILGLSVFSIIQQNYIATTFVEQFAWGALAFLLSLLSFYFISSSLFGLIIVTLPDTEPIRALRLAKQAVEHRRGIVMRKIFLICLITSTGYFLILLATIASLPALAEWVAMALNTMAITIIVGAIYMLYRELLK